MNEIALNASKASQNLTRAFGQLGLAAKKAGENLSAFTTAANSLRTESKFYFKNGQRYLKWHYPKK